MDRLQARWDGFRGAPGYTNFYFLGGTGMADAVLAFFQATTGLLVGGCTIHVPDGGDTFDEATGALTGSWGTGSERTVNSANGPIAYAGASGAVVNWKTDRINRGHKIRGRTFLVPLANLTYQEDGTITAVHLAELQAAASTFVNTAATGFGIWSRPRLGLGGLHGLATAAVVADKAAVLRSRRD